MKPISRIFTFFAVSCTAFLISGCVTEPNAFTGKSAAFGYTWQQELALGKEADGQIIQEMGLYQDDALQAYITEIGEKILSESDMRREDAAEIYKNTDFTFRVLDSEIVNAFALPGGYVYVTRGLLAHLDNEAQLAVVLGHEITHVAARHASKQALKQKLGQIGIMAGAVVTDQILESPGVANQILNVGGNLFQLITLKYGRDAERESDLHGVNYSFSAGYDTAEASEFFRSLSRIGEKSGQTIPNWMSSHPDPGERESKMLELAEERKALDPSKRLTVGRDAYLQRINGIVMGQNPRNGFTQGNDFIQPELKFVFTRPASWQLQNQASSVNMSDGSGNALIMFSIGSGSSPEAAATAFVSDSGLELASSRNTRINGLEAHLIEAQQTSEDGTMIVSCAFISYNGSIYRFAGLARDTSYPTYKAAFASAFSSFKELENRKMLAIEPTRLDVVSVDRAKPFRSFVEGALPAGLDASDLAIINQVEIDDTIPAGAKLKLPR